MRVWRNCASSVSHHRSNSSTRATIRLCSAGLPQRGGVIQPRVGAQRLPWEHESKSSSTLNGLHRFGETVMQPHWGCWKIERMTQGSSFLATLG